MGQLEALLNGARHLEPVALTRFGGPAALSVRPLSAAEATRIEVLMVTGLGAELEVANGQMVNSKPFINDLALLIESQKRAKVVAVAFALSHSGETCSEEQADGLPSQWLDELARTVFRISGINGGSEETFRVTSGMDGVGENGRGADAPPESSGYTPGPHAEGLN